MAAVAAVTSSSGGGLSAHARSVSPQPAVTGAIAFRARTAPLPTSGCVAAIGIRCYSPGQFERAYDLAPLHRFGIDGSGQTIAIVDSVWVADDRERPARVRPDVRESAGRAPRRGPAMSY